MIGSVERMGKYLKIIRVCLGYTAEVFAMEIGASRATIMCWENHKSIFNKMHYNAVSNVINKRMGEYESTEYSELIKKVVWLFVEGPYDEYICDTLADRINALVYSNGFGISEIQKLYFETLKSTLDEMEM